MTDRSAYYLGGICVSEPCTDHLVTNSALSFVLEPDQWLNICIAAAIAKALYAHILHMDCAAVSERTSL